MAEERDEVVQRLQDIRNALLRKGKVTDEENAVSEAALTLQAMKVLFRDVIGFRDPPQGTVRNEVRSFIFLNFKFE